MVLQDVHANNKDENAPPSPVPATRPKNRVARIYEDQSLRRRTRNNGTTDVSEDRAERAKRRKTKSKRGSTATTDAEMSNTASSSATSTVSRFSTTKVDLPELLSLRPSFTEVSLERIRAAEPKVTADMNLDYLRSSLQYTHPSLLKALHYTRANVMGDRLPAEIQVECPDMDDAHPTHMLAVYEFATPIAGAAISKAKVTLFPVHSLVLLTHCANLPPPPPQIHNPDRSEKHIMLPVWRIFLPSPHVYPPLSSYLYTKHMRPLLRTFLPSRVPPPADLVTNPIRQMSYAGDLAAGGCSIFEILQSDTNVRCLYLNVCKMGLRTQDPLWDAIEVMHRVLVTALGMVSGKTPITIAEPPRSTESSS